MISKDQILFWNIGLILQDKFFRSSPKSSGVCVDHLSNKSAHMGCAWPVQQKTNGGCPRLRIEVPRWEALVVPPVDRISVTAGSIPVCPATGRRPPNPLRVTRAVLSIPRLPVATLQRFQPFQPGLLDTGEEIAKSSSTLPARMQQTIQTFVPVNDQRPSPSSGATCQVRQVGRPQLVSQVINPAACHADTNRRMVMWKLRSCKQHAVHFNLVRA